MDLMREIEDARRYSRKLLGFLKETGRQWHIFGRYDLERSIRQNPFAIVQWEVYAPPPLQRFLWELARLDSITERLKQKGRTHTSLYKRLLVHEVIVQIFIHKMVLDLLAQNERVLSLFMKRKIQPVVGGGWRILFVQEIKFPLSLNKDKGT